MMTSRSGENALLSLSSMVVCMDIVVSLHHMWLACQPAKPESVSAKAAAAQQNPPFACFMPRFSG
jgi:hypothetical protein